MTLKVPVTASNPAEWIRLAGGAVNALITALAKLVGRVDAVETFDTAINGRVGALEAFAATPFTVASITLTPAALPGVPVKGQTVYDIADDKVKTWTGAAWVAHF